MEGEEIPGEAAANFACATIFVLLHFPSWTRGMGKVGVHVVSSAVCTHGKARKGRETRHESCVGEPLESSRSNNFLEPLTGLIGDSCVCLSSFVINS